MIFTNYQQFRVAMQRMIEGDDAGLGDISPDTIDMLIGLGEERIYGEFRSRFMEADLAITVTGNVATLPADFLEIKIAYFSTTRPIEVVTEQTLRNALRTNSNSGVTQQVAQSGNTLIFWPAATTGTILAGRYYKRFPDISTGLNDLFTHYSPLFLYAALAAAAPFLGQDARIVVWDAMFRNFLKVYERQETAAKFGGSNLRVRPSVNWPQ